MEDRTADDANEERESHSFTLTRRRALAGLAFAGSSGALSGAGTQGLLSDSETFGNGASGSNHIRSGSLDLEIDWIDSENASTDTAGTSTELTLQLDPDDEPPSGHALLELGMPAEDGNNPANVWFWMSCPQPSGTDVAEHLHVDIYRSDPEGTKHETIESGTLDQVAEALRDSDGRLLEFDSGECLSPGTFGYLLIEWTFDLSSFNGDLRTPAFSFEFYARQCRHSDGVGSPVSLEDCGPPADPCPCCQLVGKYEGSGDFIAPNEAVSFDEGSSDYELEIGETMTKDGGSETIGAALKVTGASGTPDPTLCKVIIKAGTETKTYHISPDDSGFTDVLLSPGGNGNQKAISSITVGVCVDKGENGCPADLVSPTGKPNSGEHGGQS